MNQLVAEVNIAAKEQSGGGKQIREVIERMKSLVHEVGLAVKEQVGSAQQIVQVIETMSTMTQGVASSTVEQKAGGETVVRAMEGISQISAENLRMSKEMVGMSEETLFQVENLQYAVSSFRIHSNGRKRCWDITHCAPTVREKCPAYEAADDRCWQVEGTWCKGEQQGDMRTKMKKCMTCEAFRVIQGIDG
jgi:hypothetical protein